MNIRILLAGFDNDMRDRLSDMLYQSEIEIRDRIVNIARGAEAISGNKPSLLLIPTQMDRKLLMLCQQICILYPGITMVVISNTVDTGIFNYAMEAGVRRVIAPLPSAEELIDALKELCTSESSRHLNHFGGNARLPKTEVLFVIGASGGIGKTTLAVNLAVKLAAQRREVVLLDFHIQYGDTDMFLGIEPKQTVAELLQEQRTPTLDTVNSYLEFHQSGLKVLFGPKSPEYAETVGGKNIEKIVGILRNYYDYIVIDGSVDFGGVNLAILDMCTAILLVAQPQINNLKNTKKALLLYGTLSMEQKIRLIMRETPSETISQADVERVLGRKVDISLPYDEKSTSSTLSQRKPVILSTPESSYTTAVFRLCSMTEGTVAVPERNKKRQAPAGKEMKKQGQDMGFLEQLEQAKPVKAMQDKNVQPGNIEYYDEYGEFKGKIHMELAKRANTPLGEDGKPTDIKTIISQLVEAGGEDIPRSTKRKLVQQIYDEAQGLGPLEKLLRDDAISGVMINGLYNVYMERRGCLELTDIRLKDDRYVLELIGEVTGPLGRRCDESNPMLGARLPDGSHVNAIIPPLSLKGSSTTIRKFSKIPLRTDNLVNFGSASFQMLQFLGARVKAGANVIVCGGTGSGKTTLLNILSAYIPDDERIVTIEDSAELQLSQRRTPTLKSRPSNAGDKGEITTRDLMRNALHMKPDRIIVGECHSDETLDMLQAMDAGHGGSITAAHANSSRDMISRLETVVLMAGMDLPIKAIREQIAFALDIIVNQFRIKDESRKTVEIPEVLGMESDVVTLQTLYHFVPKGFDTSGKTPGHYEATGIHPRVIGKTEDRGVHLVDSWFA